MASIKKARNGFWVRQVSNKIPFTHTINGEMDISTKAVYDHGCLRAKTTRFEPNPHRRVPHPFPEFSELNPPPRG
jgi:hypothetical protein